MALLLHIDTALEKAFVGLSRDGELLTELDNTVQYDHAAFVQPAIAQMMSTLHISISAIDAVGVTSGPGSYTGLRVGMASAKGICYALGKPLLVVSTLEVMAAAALETFPGFDLYAPMIDARRNEVYTALYNSQGELVLSPRAAILSGDLFKQAQHKKLLCFGSGAHKWKDKGAACFEKADYNGIHLSRLLYNSFKNNDFCNLAYAEPVYVKDFYFGASKKVK